MTRLTTASTVVKEHCRAKSQRHNAIQQKRTKGNWWAPKEKMKKVSQSNGIDRWTEPLLCAEKVKTFWAGLKSNASTSRARETNQSRPFSSLLIDPNRLFLKCILTLFLSNCTHDLLSWWKARFHAGSLSTRVWGIKVLFVSSGCGRFSGERSPGLIATREQTALPTIELRGFVLCGSDGSLEAAEDEKKETHLFERLWSLYKHWAATLSQAFIIHHHKLRRRLCVKM